MSEERASDREPSRRSDQTPQWPGAAARSAAVPRQPDGSGPPPGAGHGRRRAGAPEFGPAELAAALRESVAAVGASGPPRAGLARVRRRAKARQRRRTVVASSAGVLFLAMAVSVVTGNSFDIVPVLTGVVGLGRSDSSSSGGQASPDASGQVRTVRPPADAAGKKGPAIGPVGPASVATALAATGVPACAPADLTTVTTVDAVIGGVSYGHVEAVAQRACAVAGPPVLQVQNAAGTAAGSVVILQHVSADGSKLPQVPTWGAVLKLAPGQGYDFQFAWAPDACPAPGASISGGSTGVAATGGPTSGAAASSAAYTLSYLVENTMPTEPVDLGAACGATVYVTDIYPRDAFALPQPTGSASPQPSASAPVTTPSPAPPSPSSAPTGTAATTTAPSGSASASPAAGLTATSAATGTGSGGGSGGPGGSAPSQPTNP